MCKVLREQRLREAMRRNINLEEISDGKLYDLNDMVKAGCGDCIGCSSCCQGMGDSIVLDPLDVYRLTASLDRSAESLLTDCIELGVVDGLILPHMKMAGSDERCVFLNEAGRCRIHAERPGICRLFPLGRYYENGTFRYFLQTKECARQNRTKVKVSKWIDTPQLKENQEFIAAWHYFLKECEEMIAQNGEEFSKNLNLYLLRRFYLMPYDRADSFYEQFGKRMELARGDLGL